MILTHGANSLALKDPQEYDYTDVPTGSLFPDRVPMDQAKWEGSFVDTDDQLGIVQTEEDALWVGAFDTMEDSQGVVQTEEDAAWSGSFVEMQDLPA